MGKGEAIDYKDNRTGQLGLCIYDQATAAPIMSSAENTLIPAEALYEAVEVKTILTRKELGKCIAASVKVRQLRPFKRRFVASRVDGDPADDNYRCPYIVFAYTSDPSEDNWASKEYARLREEATRHGAAINLIDRVVVLNRGMLHPQNSIFLERTDSKGIFLDF